MTMILDETMIERQCDALHEARYVFYSENLGQVFIWHGGYTVNVYSLWTYECIDCWTMGMDEKPTLEDAMVSIREHIIEMMKHWEEEDG